MRFAFARAVLARRGFSLGILLACYGLWPHLCMAAPLATAFGEYQGDGCPPKEQAGACLPTSASDRVRILPDKEVDARVKVKIVFDKGHTCAVEGAAAWSDDHFLLRADGLDPDQPCQLKLRLAGSELTLEDSGARCREVYCGARGAFEGARFKKKR